MGSTTDVCNEVTLTTVKLVCVESESSTYVRGFSPLLPFSRFFRFGCSHDLKIEFWSFCALDALLGNEILRFLTSEE